MREKQCVKLVMLYLVKKGEAVALLQNSDISVVLLRLEVYLIQLGVWRLLICCVRTANSSSSGCVSALEEVLPV